MIVFFKCKQDLDNQIQEPDYDREQYADDHDQYFFHSCLPMAINAMMMTVMTEPKYMPKINVIILLPPDP